MSDASFSPRPAPPAAATTVIAVRWSELAPWLLLLRALRVALMARVIILAMAGVLATQTGWSLIEGVLSIDDARPPLVRLSDTTAPSLLSPTQAIRSEVTHATASPTPQSGPQLGQPFVVASGPVNVVYFSVPQTTWPLSFETIDNSAWSGPLARGWAWVVQPLSRLWDARGWSPWFALHLAGLWTIAVWALFGGAIARIAALYLSRGETIGPVVALKAAVMKWPSTAGAPACAYLGLALLALPLLAAGFVVRADFFAFLLGLVWIAVLLLGLAAAVVGLGLLFGWPLMWATVAVERTDAFDAISRSYAYLFQRPLHTLFFVLAATVLGLVGQTALSTFVDASLATTRWLAGVGAGGEHAEILFDGVEPPKPLVAAPEIAKPAAPPMPDSTAEPAATPSDSIAAEEKALETPSPVVGMFGHAGGAAMRFWTRFFAWIATCFPMAYIWPAATAIYLLLRRLIDATEMTESSYDQPPPHRGLPPLAPDPALGVPRVVSANGAPDADETV